MIDLTRTKVDYNKNTEVQNCTLKVQLKGKRKKEGSKMYQKGLKKVVAFGDVK